MGERLLIGSTEVELRAILATEPDALSDGFGFAPRLMIGMEAVEAADLRRPGSLYEEGVKLRLPPGTTDAEVAAIREAANEAFPQAGWSIRDRGNAAPALSANITRFGQFLTLVGLTALIVGGVGVANAVRSAPRFQTFRHRHAQMRGRVGRLRRRTLSGAGHALGAGRRRNRPRAGRARRADRALVPSGHPAHSGRRGHLPERARSTPRSSAC